VTHQKAQPFNAEMNMPTHFIIVGSGLLGRLLAFQVAVTQPDWQITLIDKDTVEGQNSCGYVGAGMLSPFSELEWAEPLIAEMGLASLPLWESLLNDLSERTGLSVFFQKAGTLVVSHPQDQGDWFRFEQTVTEKSFELNRLERDFDGNPAIRRVNGAELKNLEPDLSGRFSQGLYLEQEGQLDNRALMKALGAFLANCPQLDWRTETLATQVLSGAVTVEPIESASFLERPETLLADWVVDTRGLGGRSASFALRGVRGEILRLFAPEVKLNRPVRLMHPRYPLYMAPRPNHQVIVGATSIESEDNSAMSVQSAMELLSAAYSIHTGFAEARVLEMQVQCRPALPDNLPKIKIRPGLIRANGLYRHGFLIAPVMVQLILEALGIQTSDSLSAFFNKEMASSLASQISTFQQPVFQEETHYASAY
jgi:glycine oxidase